MDYLWTRNARLLGDGRDVCAQQGVPFGATSCAQRVIAWIDSFSVGVASLGFIAAAVVAAIYPEAVRIKPGVPDHNWLHAGGIAMLGLSAAVGHFRERSMWRLTGAIVLFVSAYLFVHFTPLNFANNPVAFSDRIELVFPSLVAACWYVFVFLVFRRSTAMHRRVWTPTCGIALAAMSILLFVCVIFWQPQTGLQRAVACFDLKTGECLWERPAFIAPQEKKDSRNTSATPTPCTDGKYVFAHFGSGFACFTVDGRLLWHEIDSEYFDNARYGSAASPVMVGDSVIVLQERELINPGDGLAPPAAGYIVALEKESGRHRWRVQPEYAYDSYASPLLLQRGPTPQLLAATRDMLAAYDTESGELLWSHDIPIWQIVPSIVSSDDRLYIAGGEPGHNAILAIGVSGVGKYTETETVWHTNKSVPQCSSPVLYDGKLFVVTDLGVMTCFDAASGNVHWKKRLPGEYHSSLVAGDGKIYACNRSGLTTVLAADAEFRVLAENDLGEPTSASPAFSKGCILIRTANHLYCIDKEAEDAASSTL